MEFKLTEPLREAVRSALESDEADSSALQRYLRADASSMLLEDVKHISRILRKRATASKRIEAQPDEADDGDNTWVQPASHRAAMPHIVRAWHRALVSG